MGAGGSLEVFVVQRQNGQNKVSLPASVGASGTFSFCNGRDVFLEVLLPVAAPAAVEPVSEMLTCICLFGRLLISCLDVANS